MATKHNERHQLRHQCGYFNYFRHKNNQECRLAYTRICLKYCLQHCYHKWIHYRTSKEHFDYSVAIKVWWIGWMIQHMRIPFFTINNMMCLEQIIFNLPFHFYVHMHSNVEQYNHHCFEFLFGSLSFVINLWINCSNFFRIINKTLSIIWCVRI